MQRLDWIPMEPREFVYTGELPPKIENIDNMDFVLLLQKSMLHSLVKRGLLTPAQMDCAMSELEKKYRKLKP